MSSPNHLVTPTKRSASATRNRSSDGELLQSLQQLSLSASPLSAPVSAPTRSPSSTYKPALDRSPSSLSLRRSPSTLSLKGGPSSGRESRSATPTLLRKASVNSLHSVNGVAPPRRSNSNSNSTNMSPTTSRMSWSPDPSRPPPPSANSIARTHFSGELELLHGDESGRAADTLVVLHDACYGHRFSRPKTTRAGLATIVERPERIKATVLGVAAAYVLLGERHVDGEYPPRPDLNTATIPSVPFRIQKSTRRMSLNAPAVTNVHGTKWMEELKIMCESAEAKLALGGKELQRPEATNRGSDQEQPKKLHEGDLYLCSESLDALEGSLGAVCDAVDAVFKNDGPKRAFVAVRPPGHHCSASYPSGFCWVNNVHVGIMHAILAHGLTHAAIIDFDLHHGDGSQSIAWQHNSRGVGLAKNALFWKKASIGYYSLHDINSYPCEMGDEEKVKNASLCMENAHGQNVWNVHLEPWKTEAEFWALYEDKYTVLLQKARKYLKAHTERLRATNQNSKAAIFFSAGFDASEWEGAGMQRHSVNVPTSFYARIARDVTKIAEEEGTSVQGRVISVLEGGYSDRALTSGVLSHISGLAGSDPVPMGSNAGVGGEMAGRTGLMGDRRNSLELKMRPHSYDPSWWNSESLELLENGVVFSPPPARVPKTFTPGNYSSPTHSSTAKMVEVARLRRQASMNGLAPPRPPTPPPAEVSWYVAAHGLCTVLVPTNRSTTSCRPDELSAEATRIRRERQLALEGLTDPQVAPVAMAPPPPPRPAPSRMSLRERKTTKSYFEGGDDDDLVKNRRKTVAGALSTSEKSGSQSNTSQFNSRAPSRQAGRRLSAASTVPVGFDGAPDVFTADRPTTSMTERPETSFSIRTTATAPPLQVKKTRTNNATKKDAPPKAPRAKKAPAPPATKNSSKSSSSAHPPPSRTPAQGGGDDLDKITSGIKKITLVTNKQKQARAREAKNLTGTSAPSTPSVGSEINASSLPVTPKDEALLQRVPYISNGDDTPKAISPTGQPVQEIKQEMLDTPVFDLTKTDMTGVTTPTAQTVTPDNFVHYQPDGPAPEIVTPQQPLNWLPVNTGANLVSPSTVAPSPMKRADLPVFTATSQLHFASREDEQPTAPASSSSDAPIEWKVNEVVWDVPQAPQ